MNEDKQKKFADNLAKTVRRVLYAIQDCKKEKRDYDRSINYKGGNKAIINLESLEAQIICDSIESGNSIRMTLMIVNHNHMEDKLPLLGYALVLSCYHWMEPQVEPIKKQ